MNCANHPERQATAFCQNCGKPLCSECLRTHNGLVLCEPCFLLLGGSPAAAGTTPGTSFGTTFGATPGASPAGAPAWDRVPPVVAPPYPPTAAYPRSHASPVLAGFLGLIPGVGAMYNGQFIKALLHVVIFIVLIGASEHFGLAGILIAAWVFYQVFDAAQTASARRDGRPLPDPFGILDMSQRLGPQPGGAGRVPPAYAAPAPVPNAAAGWQPGAGPRPYAPAAAMPGAEAPRPVDPAGTSPTGWASAPVPGPTHGASQAYSPVAPMIPVPPTRRSEPIGAIVLILVGLLLLMSTLGLLDMDWLYRGWPVLILALGIWLLYRRVTAPTPYAQPMEPKVGYPVQATPPAGSQTGLAKNPLSISPETSAITPTDEEQR